ncbi:MAG: hypothetical protein QM500_09970 [Methylococcales bacterium]
MKKHSVLLTFGLLFSHLAFAEDEEQVQADLPDTEIYLFDLSVGKKGYVLSNGKNISNNLGYDNQPFFTPSSKTMLFASMRDGKQIDIYEYHLKSAKTEQITATDFMEYSPKASVDNKTISFVRDGENPDQTVWQMDRKTGKYTWAINSKEPVGYYHINYDNGDVLFWSRYGWNVSYLNLKRDEGRFVMGNAIPSTPKQIPNSNKFSFVHRQTNSEVWIKAFDPIDYSVTPIAPIYGTNNDYAWAPNGDIFRIEENYMYLWKAKNNKGWEKIQDLTKEFKGKISRLAISPNGKTIALVENR